MSLSADDLLAPVGGSATASSVSFKVQLGAFLVAQLLGERPLDERLRLRAARICSIQLETVAPLDDILTETEAGGHVFTQSKLAVTKSRRFLADHRPCNHLTGRGFTAHCTTAFRNRDCCGRLNRMLLNRHLARLLAAVIVMIAASFGVSAVQAHEGYVHHHPTPAASAAPVAAAPVQEAAKPATAPVAITADFAPLRMMSLVTQAASSAGQTAMAVSAPGAEDCGDCSGCNGLCCGMGMACGHSALTPASITAAAPTLLAVMVPAPQQAAPPGLPPETLPKPPRPFA